MVKSTLQLGKIFMRKYPLIFDQDNNTINFVYLNKFIEKEVFIKRSSFKKIIDFFKYFLFFIGLLIGLFLGRRIWNKNRKLRANELEEKFEYISELKI